MDENDKANFDGSPEPSVADTELHWFRRWLPWFCAAANATTATWIVAGLTDLYRRWARERSIRVEDYLFFWGLWLIALVVFWLFSRPDPRAARVSRLALGVAVGYWLYFYWIVAVFAPRWRA